MNKQEITEYVQRIDVALKDIIRILTETFQQTLPTGTLTYKVNPGCEIQDGHYIDINVTLDAFDQGLVETLTMYFPCLSLNSETEVQREAAHIGLTLYPKVVPRLIAHLNHEQDITELLQKVGQQ